MMPNAYLYLDIFWRNSTSVG